jgi:hypothetical protein
LTGSLRLGGAIPTGEEKTVPAAELKLRCSNFIPDLGLYGEVRHLFSEAKDSYWRGRSRWVAGADLDLGGGAKLFGEHRRHYRSDDSWWFTGLRIDF